MQEEAVGCVAKQRTVPILKPVERWLGFQWRNPEASGSQSIFWYDRRLETGIARVLDAIVEYNEDNCLATRHLKDWLVTFIQNY